MQILLVMFMCHTIFWQTAEFLQNQNFLHFRIYVLGSRMYWFVIVDFIFRLSLINHGVNSDEMSINAKSNDRNTNNAKKSIILICICFFSAVLAKKSKKCLFVNWFHADQSITPIYVSVKVLFFPLVVYML